ncbi:WD40 repeat-like protein [Lentinula aciculospora]|uniref:WD40 repeat-like protein n=1 Tax=Lentinula aciculospora TaxID=153920 RepID=A0A9W9A825_9AGAR|nr:WD40 repeat-like protein [Lentinula aciculospora]
MPIDSPPTPAPSPGPNIMAIVHSERPSNPSSLLDHPVGTTTSSTSPLALPQNPVLRRQYLSAVIHACTPTELLFISSTIAPLLKRDFLRVLPPELALHILSFVDDPKTLARAAQVSWWWRRLYKFDNETTMRREPYRHVGGVNSKGKERMSFMEDDERLNYGKLSTILRDRSTSQPTLSIPVIISHREHFKYSYSIMQNWHNGGHLLRAHKVPSSSTNPESGVVTSLALDEDWVVVGLANCRIHVFSARTGVLARTLVGHDLGVWAVCLVHKGGYMGGPDPIMKQQEGGNGGKIGKRRKRKKGLRSRKSEEIEEEIISSSGSRKRSHYPGKPSGVSGSSEGWGQPGALVVSGGCDKVVRVWDIRSGYCIYVLRGHTSTIRCIKVLHNRPIAVSGSRDNTLRVWDVQRGRSLRILAGHTASVRCLDVCGNRVVSGSYDHTCRLWDVDTGECLHVLRGHLHQIYSVAFDGVRIASGGLDTTVRVWDAETGECKATLQGHTALVCQLQLSPTMLATGGSDGRVIMFSLPRLNQNQAHLQPFRQHHLQQDESNQQTETTQFQVLQRIAAHDSSVTALQFDHRFLVTGGNDGRVKLFETQTGKHVRDLSEPSESVWKVAYGPGGEICVIMCRRQGKTIMEFWSLKPREDKEVEKDREKERMRLEEEKNMGPVLDC